MSSPKHLWSGDWQEESASAAADRAGTELPEMPEPVRATAPPPPPVRAPAPAPTPVAARPPAPAAPPRVTDRTPPRPRPDRSRRAWRIGILAAVLVGLIVGGTIALASSNGSNSGLAPAAGPFLGIQMESVPINRVLVDGVVPGSPADQAGVGPGDIVVAVNGKAVSSPGDVEADLSGLHAGDTVSLAVKRGPQTFSTKATLTRQPAGYP